ncbi:ABC transporter substrate-binding protein [Ramlibacter sp. AW1]|uniref:ABC transporter substrate-binding protein n=1 Tax=Ramlibacter aurantiacus TaxID=2801330 RepID=A0A936ZZR3_9BURK|nr:ABC transporter substrate-binding protein [Ramlibacter aurantiacus]MBL0423434.1 ABC transporter substrate-binding protein [Ramlibacter aurantiacus]
MKKNLSVSYAGHLSDRVQDLYYGKVAPEGIDLHYLPLQPFEAFNRMLRGDFDAAEMSFSTYLIQKARGQMPFVAIPVFPSRTFRHGAIYVNSRAGITTPKELEGRRIGVPEYQMTAAVWTRGLLQHEYGVSPAACTWFTGGLTSAGRKPMVASEVPGVSIRHVADRTLDDMLVQGELDAVIAPQPPPSFTQGHEAVARLFPDYPAAERAYWRKTRIFPIMHVVVLRKELFEANPWAAISLYQAFEQARRNAMEFLRTQEPPALSWPWAFEFGREIREMMGEDFWPYGIEPNRREIEALCQYVTEQGLAPRKLAIDELFAPNVAGLTSLKL